MVCTGVCNLRALKSNTFVRVFFGTKRYPFLWDISQNTFVDPFCKSFNCSPILIPQIFEMLEKLTHTCQLSEFRKTNERKHLKRKDIPKSPLDESLYTYFCKKRDTW